MAKNKKQTTAPKLDHVIQPATLKDLLNPEIIAKLTARTKEMQAEEAKLKEEIKEKAEEARKIEQKRLENDFEHLLNNSKSNWRKY